MSYYLEVNGKEYRGWKAALLGLPIVAVAWATASFALLSVFVAMTWPVWLLVLLVIATK